MANMPVLVTVVGTVHDIQKRQITNKDTGEISLAHELTILTADPADQHGGGFASVYVSPDDTAVLPPDARGAKVELLVRAYPVTRNYGTEERPKFGKALGLSYVSGRIGSPAMSAPTLAAAGA